MCVCVCVCVCACLSNIIVSYVSVSTKFQILFSLYVRKYI